MKRIYPLLLFLFFATCTFAQVKEQTVTKSSVVFHIKNLGFTVDGTLAGFKGEVKFDPADLAASSITASVDVNTIDTDNGTRNDHLKSDNYFDVAKYPDISMKSVSFKHNSGSNYTGTFSLTIKDKTNTIAVPFTYTESVSGAEFKGNFQIQRTTYGVGGKSLVMSNDVKVDISITTTK
ncbi:YceI family protein [Mucilaginibacter ginsenosidivorans]|uniref:YceI family protein n=1 Tax=Mucilaginibacter ginsenosidivorans TaxID=398053 RepID=A0A5B8UQA4_9SPHI|nr:YceI family protein [Mucilaginibacter ginsenosidivorans]QEC61270.1 YceI family protein [Mucilaginibacter ginsenosidivorans]